MVPRAARAFLLNRQAGLVEPGAHLVEGRVVVVNGRVGLSAPRRLPVQRGCLFGG